MKAHDLARQLLAGPDIEVLTAYDDVPEQANSLGEPKVESRLNWDPEDPNVLVPTPCVVLYYGNDGDAWPEA